MAARKKAKKTKTKAKKTKKSAVTKSKSKTAKARKPVKARAKAPSAAKKAASAASKGAKRAVPGPKKPNPALKKFSAAIKADPKLREKLRQPMTADAFHATTVKLGAELGHHFTTAESKWHIAETARLGAPKPDWGGAYDPDDADHQ
jgi:hypothetical protein